MMKRLGCALLFVYALADSITVSAQTRNLTGSMTASSTDCSVAGSCVVFRKNPNDGTVAVQLTGTFTATIQFEGSVDYAFSASPNWFPLAGSSYAGGSPVTSSTGTGGWQLNTSGLTGFRVRASALTSGTVGVSFQAGTEALGGGGGAGGSGGTSSNFGVGIPAAGTAA